MTDLRTRPEATPRRTAPRRLRALYPRLLGAAWDDLDESVQRLHADDAVAGGGIEAEGCFQVVRAPGRLLGLILDAAGVPPSADAAEVRLSVVSDRLGDRPVERWQRAFGGRPLVTVQYEAPGGLLGERAGILELRFQLAVQDRALLFRQQSQALCLGGWRLPLPNWLAMRVSGRAGPVEQTNTVAGHSAGAVRVDVRVSAPTGSLLFAYRGVIRFGLARDEGDGPSGSAPDLAASKGNDS